MDKSDKMNNVCRFCLKTTALLMHSIHDGTIQTQIGAIFSFLLENNDSFPSKICSECSDKLTELYTFAETVRTNQEKLKAKDQGSLFVQIKLEPLFVEQDEEIKYENVSPSPEEHKTEDPDEMMCTEVELKDPGVESDDEHKDDLESDEEHNDADNGSNESEDNLGKLDGKKPKVNKARKLEEENKLIKEFFPLKCETCSDSFDSFCELNQHSRKLHNKPVVFTCCGREFTKRCHILSHINFHLNPNQFHCEICNKSYSRKYALELHRLRRHTDNVREPFKCDQCGLGFHKEFVLNNHIRNSHIQAECSICNKTLSNATSLRNHVNKVHSAGETFICDTCGKQFRSKQALEHHFRQHLGSLAEKVQCNICSRFFNCIANLKSHLKNVHSEGKTKVTCDVCNQTYPNRKSLTTHKARVHVAEKFECEVCGKKFKRLVCLTEHRAVHTGQTLYSCGICGMSTNSNANLYAHKKAKHPEEWMEAKKKAFEGGA